MVRLHCVRAFEISVYKVKRVTISSLSVRIKDVYRFPSALQTKYLRPLNRLHGIV